MCSSDVDAVTIGSVGHGSESSLRTSNVDAALLIDYMCIQADLLS